MATISRRNLLAAAAMAPAASLVTFRLASGADVADVNMQIGWLGGNGILGETIGLKKGFFAEEGLDLEITPGGPNVDGIAAVASGAANFGQYNSTTSIMLARSQGKVPNAQVWFNKQVSCINSPFGDVHLPVVSEMLDYEVELCVVIGKRCRHVPASEARSVIAGYMVANDFTVRDWASRSPTMTVGKSFDTHGPVGPWITTDDEVADPHQLTLRLFVNGELRQEESSGGMIANIYQQIAELTAAMTLDPGDLLATGTPSGVGIALTPPRLLKAGDIVRAEVESLGHIENRIVPEPV